MSSERKPSLFAQKMQKLRELQSNKNTGNVFNDLLLNSSPFGEQSYIVNGKEAETIHQENVAVLSAMSEAEILEKQKELLETLKPENIEFLKKRRKIQSNMDLESSFSTLSTNESSLNIDLELKDKGLHMDVVEPEKLKWTEDVLIANQPLPDSLFNARFDFEGNLLPYIEENRNTFESGLHNHGEEQHRPGYTIEELYQLSRSYFLRQRILALNTLASILEKEVLLSVCLETELIKALVDSGIFLILRFSLDEQLKPVYLAALRAVAFLFWRESDMHYLSDMVGIFGDLKLPSFEVNSDTLDSNKLDEITDVELIKQDIVKGALRTDIIRRFRYLMDDPLLEINHLLCITKCLIRFCYHSHETTEIVVKTPTLIEILFQRCISSMQSPRTYVAKLMILLRVISCRSEKFAVDLSNRLHIVPFLLEVLCNPVTKASISTQCIYLWHVLLLRGIELDSVTKFSPMLYSLLKPLLSITAGNLKTSVISNASAWITFLMFAFERSYETVKFLVPDLQRMCCQWMNIIINEEEYPAEFLKLVANTIYLLSKLAPTDVDGFHKQMQYFLTSPAYLKIIGGLENCSFLIHACKKNFVDSLPSLCVPVHILQTKYTLLILHSTLKYCSEYGDISSVARLLNNQVWDYVNRALTRSNLAEIANLWCSRYEILFLVDIVKFFTKWKVGRNRDVLRLAFALVRMIHADDAIFIEEIFSQVIFNPEVFERVILDQCRTSAVLTVDLESMEQFFIKELNLPKRNVSLMSSKRGTECALSTDWYYVPILKISNARNAHVKVDQDTIRPLLRWIHLIEYLADDIEMYMSLAARYCRVSCIFFCGDVFLEVTDILYEILREMLKRNHKLEFKSPIPGIDSFYFFYCELCEQFASTSYCNPIFAMYVLVPLQQKHDCELRRYVWTEQAIMLRFITLSTNELLIPISCYLEPCETNLNLVKTYLQMIGTGKVKEQTCPVMYHIALHHVATFVNKFKDETVAQRLRQIIENIGTEDLRNKFLSYVYQDLG